MQINKRLLGWVGATLLVSAMLGACGSDSNSGDATPGEVPTSADDIDPEIDTSKVQKSITVGVDNPYYLFHHDVLIAEDKGYFKDVGIEKVKIVTTEDPLPALVGGSLDFAAFDTDTTIAAAEKSGTGMKYLGTYLGGEGNILGVGPGIKSAADLKGKTITGGQSGSRNDFLMRKLLSDNGIDPDKDVNLVSTGGQSNQRLQSVISGTVDGASLQYRHRALLEAEGGQFLFENLNRAPQNGWAANQILEKSPETAAAFMQATLKARQFITDMTNKDEVLSIMKAEGFDIPAEYADAYEFENAKDYHTSDAGFEMAEMDAFINEQIKLKVVPEGTKWKDYMQLLPLWRAQKSLDLPLRPSPEDFAK